ncbi:NYN domain-containing protein [Streptomyces sp. NPDC087440]|uniref:NYN domain-containing protein n=1 Tax=Streptomyces sp. NPDC087440 TaxID=3365790 RepID=UPI0037F575E6
MVSSTTRRRLHVTSPAPAPARRTPARATGPGRFRRLWSRWPRWSLPAAMVWSVLYGAAHVYWALGGAGYPFARVHEDRASASVLDPSPVGVVSPALAAFCAVAVGVGVLMWRQQRSGRAVSRRVRAALVGFGWVAAGLLALAIPDYTLIMLVAFGPLLVVFAFTGLPGPQGGLEDLLYWHRDHLVLVFVGGLLWALATLAHQRRTADRCTSCGRGERAAAAWTRPDRALSWGRKAVWVAVLATIPYDLTRLAWYFGLPLGITDAFLKEMQDTPGMLTIGLGLGILSTVGSLLTHGLVSRWGEVWPRWVWFRAGRPVDPRTAIVPASLVALVLVPGGLMNLRSGMDAQMWGTNGPMLFWVVWGLGLGAATYSYHLRRRTTCGTCRRG